MICLNAGIGSATSAVSQAAKQKRMTDVSQHARISIGIIQPVEELSMMMRNKSSGEMAQSNQTKKIKYDHAYLVQKRIYILGD